MWLNNSSAVQLSSPPFKDTDSTGDLPTKSKEDLSDCRRRAGRTMALDKDTDMDNEQRSLSAIAIGKGTH